MAFDRKKYEKENIDKISMQKKTYNLKNKERLKVQKKINDEKHPERKSIYRIKKKYNINSVSEKMIFLERIRLFYNRADREEYKNIKINNLLIKSIVEFKKWRKKNEPTFKKIG